MMCPLFQTKINTHTHTIELMRVFIISTILTVLFTMFEFVMNKMESLITKSLLISLIFRAYMTKMKVNNGLIDGQSVYCPYIRSV